VKHKTPPKTRTVKAYIAIHPTTGKIEYAEYFRGDECCVHYTEAIAIYEKRREAVEEAFKSYKIVPCTITYTIPKKNTHARQTIK
jgi:outer membrane protein assembly factor BamD (BamD/ComL family)